MTTGAQEPSLERLKEVLAEVADISHAEHVLDWDARVFMPRGGAKADGALMPVASVRRGTP